MVHHIGAPDAKGSSSAVYSIYDRGQASDDKAVSRMGYADPDKETGTWKAGVVLQPAWDILQADIEMRAAFFGSS